MEKSRQTKKERTRFCKMPAILCLVSVILSGILYAALTPPDSWFKQPYTFAFRRAAPAAGEAVTEDAKAGFEEITNILLIGADYADERATWDKETYADTIIVLAVNFKKRTVDMISVPRDTYAEIYETPGNWKINQALYLGGGYEKNGPEYVMKSVRQLLGVPVAYYIGVDIPAFKDIIDALGGMDYNVDVEVNMQGRRIARGYQHLNGQGVMDYCRARKGIDNDLGRIDRQKRILKELFRQLKGSGRLEKLPSVLAALLEKMHTNLSFEQICALLNFGMGLSDKDIRLHTLLGETAPVFNWIYLVADQEKKAALIKEVYGVDIEQDAEKSVMGVQRKWAEIQAKKYMEYVNNALPQAGGAQSGFSPAAVSRLRAAVSEVQAALNSRSLEQINAAKDGLRKLANQLIEAEGLPLINWYVKENG